MINLFAFFFIIGAATLLMVIASCSIVGEKQEQSLEPLLATPTTDGEILLGKSIGALLPPLIAIWIGAVIFMGMIDCLPLRLSWLLLLPGRCHRGHTVAAGSPVGHHRS